jgi:two-component system, NtrC family, nitrogen regulation response regulator NtrX
MSARILVVDDEANIRALIDEILSEEGYEVTTAADAGAARAARREQDFDLTLLDIWMPDTDGISLLKEWSENGVGGAVFMMSGHGTVDTAVEATRLGAVDFIEKPVSLSKLLRTVEKALVVRRNKEQRRVATGQATAPAGKSAAMRSLREQVARIAQHDAPVLFTGESGSGRELSARYLASQSGQARGPFVAVMGGDLSDDNTQRELLGDGAEPGALERAEDGILLIQELGDIGPNAQRLLSSVLEQRSFRPTGQLADRPLGARILSSGFPGFERSDSLRPELMSHLSVVVIRVPPLREHPEDVPELLRYHVDLLVDAEGLSFRRFSVAAQNRLRNYPWPGNVRELRNLVKRLLILGGGEEISLADVEAQIAPAVAEGEPLVKQDLLAMPLREAREHFERAYLQQQLSLCGGKVGQLAKRVGMERTHLYRKLRSLGVDFRQSLTDD